MDIPDRVPSRSPWSVGKMAARPDICLLLTIADSLISLVTDAYDVPPVNSTCEARVPSVRAFDLLRGVSKKDSTRLRVLKSKGG